MAIPTGSAHYKGGKVEPLELIESQGLRFDLACVVKYAVRANYHGDQSYPDSDFAQAVDSVNKAIWYLERWKEVHGVHKVGDKEVSLVETPRHGSTRERRAR